MRNARGVGRARVHLVYGEIATNRVDSVNNVDDLAAGIGDKLVDRDSRG